ncbi:hypothetical protein GCM10010391_67400 [Streptomyces anthocyanicus]|nr:hypothetical protein GCM10010391_67400 [Streptomyces anthocyanicus]
MGAGARGARPGVAGCRCAHPCRPSGTTARSWGGVAAARSDGGGAAYGDQWDAERGRGRAAYGEEGACRGVSARSGWRVNAPSLFK